MTKIILGGAGPAGIGTALTLVNSSKKDLEIIMIDQGKRIENRKQDNSTDKAYGFSGVGPFSDGKFIFDTILGKRQIGTNLSELIGERDIEYLKKAKEQFRKFYEPIFGEMKEASEERIKKALEISRLAGIHDMDYIMAHDYHIGTDRLPELMKSIQDYLEKKGVTIITSERIVDFEKGKVYTEKVDGVQNGQKQEYNCDYFFLAPGRNDSAWLQSILKKRKIKHSSRPIDIGLRIETDSNVLKHLTDIERDVKLEFRHQNGDLIRTFCVCPYGAVSTDVRKPEWGGLDFCLVNGASSSEHLSDNTNFALLVRMPLREDGDNAAWGRRIAQTYKEAGVNRIVMQRMGDLNNERSSKPGKIHEWRVKPTLPSELYMPGDVRIGMPSRIMDDLRYGLKKLSVPGLLEGLDQDSTLLYGPEIKMHGNQIATDKYLQSVSMPRFYVGGDGSGMTRGIGGAWSSGILAAEGILKEIE
jgi:hypothetical protein